MLGKEYLTRTEQALDNDQPLFEPSAKTQRTVSAPVTRALANKKNTKRKSSSLDNREALEVIKDQGNSLRLCTRKGSQYALLASKLFEFNIKNPLEALTLYGAERSSTIFGQGWLAAL